MQESLFNKVAERCLQMFAVNFSKFFRTVIFKNTSGQLPLENKHNNEPVNNSPNFQ